MLGLPSVAPPVGLVSARLTVSFPSTSGVVNDGNADGLIGRVAIGKADGLTSRRCSRRRRGRAVAGREGDSHGAALPPVRVIVIVALPPFSATL